MNINMKVKNIAMISMMINMQKENIIMMMIMMINIIKITNILKREEENLLWERFLTYLVEIKKINLKRVNSIT